MPEIIEPLEVCAECDSTPCECCSFCNQSPSDCDCCSRCDSTRDDCDCCSRCEQTAGNCECCSGCARHSDDCVCCENCGDDRSGCDCRTCSDCDQTRSSDDFCCSNCSDCCDCCTCRHCSACDNTVDNDDFCTVCNECNECCNEEHDEVIATSVSAPAAPAGLPDGFVECEDCRVAVLAEFICKKHYDYSVGRTQNYCFTCCSHKACLHDSYTEKCQVCKRCITCCTCLRCPVYGDRTAQICEACNRGIQNCICLRRCNRGGNQVRHCSHLVAEGESFCTDCRKCDEVCSCPKCPGCSSKGGVCGLCKECLTCCRAGDCGGIDRDSAVIQFKKRELKFYSVKTLKDRRRNPSPRELSVELETTGRAYPNKGKLLHNALEKWSDAVVADGSISSGHEINTNPSGGDFFLDHIRDICDGFESMGVTADKKCGMHVHVNCKDITFYDLRKVLMLYEHLERALFDACHPRRLNDSYSLKCGHFFTANVAKIHPTEFKQNIYGMLYNEGKRITKAVPKTDKYGYAVSRTNSADVHKARIRQGEKMKRGIAVKSHDLRYRALNLHSYFHRGSIEFRHHEGSTDYAVITGFARICGEIINVANRLSESQIKALPKNSRKAMRHVLPPDLEEFILQRWAVNDKIRNDNRALYGPKYEEAWGF